MNVRTSGPAGAMAPPISGEHSTSRPKSRSGLTLLELILALSLSVVILAIIGMSIDFHLRALESRQTVVEESILARSILRMIADDLRNSVEPFEADMSVVEQMMANMVKQSAGDVGDLLGDTVIGGSSGSDSGGGVDAGGRGGGGDSGAGGAGGSDSGDDSALGDDLLDDPEAADEPMDVASTAEVPAKPGIYGNQAQILIDASRLPRVDEYMAMTMPDPDTGAVDLASDVKSIAYFVQPAQNGASTSTESFQSVLAPDANLRAGLVRRVRDRAVIAYASENGTLTQQDALGDVVAPEVVNLQFQYFDGYEWWPEWDSNEMEGLPVAVEVVLTLQSRPPRLRSFVSASPTAALRNYRMVVRLPVATPVVETEEDEAAMGL